MEDRTLVPGAPTDKVELPATRPACRAEIDRVRGEIDAIKAQIAATDLERQATCGKMDPRWYHRARTAIRYKRQQISVLAAHMQALPPDPGGRSTFKDLLIEVLRDEFDDDAWQGLVDRAHALYDQRAGA
jgi:hypothetical protein